MRRDFHEEILDATERLLGRLGYRRMTMDEIARESGVARRTIYLHFESKEQVALTSIDRVVDRLLDQLRIVACSDRPPADRVRAMLITRVLFRFDSVQDYYQSFTDMFAAIRPSYLARRERYFDAEAKVFIGVLEEGREQGVFRFEDALRTAHTLLLATNALLPFSLSTRELGAREEIESKAAEIAELVTNGLCVKPVSSPSSIIS
jgi:AcrR family transcriptional regulator